MIKEVKYNGFSATPSDYECPDGDLAALVNIVPDEGHLRTVLPPLKHFNLTDGKEVCYVHESTTFGTHYIIIEPTARVFYWRTLDNDTLHEIHSFGSSVTFHNISSVGNTLEILTDNGMFYFFWKDNDYLDLGNHMPEPVISFGLQGEAVRSNLISQTFGAEGTMDPDGRYIINISESDRKVMSDGILGNVNKFISEQSVEAGRFLYPFFVRCAYRLYDGSLTMHSAPILMVASANIAPRLLIKEFWGDTGSRYSGMRYYIFGVMNQLDYCVNQACISELQNWSDIIKSVDIFVSKPIYSYDQNGEIKNTCVKSTFYNTTFNTYSMCYHTNQTGSYTRYYQMNTYRRIYKFTYGDDLRGLSGDMPGLEIEIPQKPYDTLKREIQDNSLCYYLQSINVENLQSERTIIPIETKYLETLVAREALTDDYDSHDFLIPKYAHSYNSRLNIANLRKRIFSGYNAFSSFCFTNGFTAMDGTAASTTESVYVIVCIKEDGKVIYVQGDQGTLAYENAYLYYYYPNPNAYKAIIVRSSTSRPVEQRYIEIALQPHAMLNGAFYFGGWDEAYTYCSTLPNISSNEERTINLANKIYTSEVNNPFYFPALGINTVGLGTIFGISTAAKALSQGQFGQFPLYAFTTEGVWALEVQTGSDNVGLYKTSQPITRDVCISEKSITQLDSSVVFASDRGVMLLTGSQSQCISDTLTSDDTFNLSLLPHISDVLSLSSLTLNNCTYASFLTFVKNCRMLYSYSQQRIIVYNPSYSYAYVYSIKAKAWGIMLTSIKCGIPSYPEALAMLTDGTLADFNSITTTESELTGIKGALITRPLKLDGANIMKTVDTVIQRGNFQTGHVKSVLYGSRDLQNWSMIWNSSDHYLRGFRGTPYKYFRIALLLDLDPDESIFGSTFQFTPKLINKPR